VINTKEYSDMIIAELGEFIKPNERGLYTLGRTSPVIRLDGSAFVIKVNELGQEYRRPILNIQDLSKEDVVYTESGKAYSKQEIKSFLYYTYQNRNRSFRAEELVNDFIKINVMLGTKYVRHHPDPETKYSNCFIDSIYENIVESDLTTLVTNLLRPLLDVIEDFQNNDRWKLYFVRNNGNTIHIEKGVDWRIAEYYRLTGQEDDHGYEDQELGTEEERCAKEANKFLLKELQKAPTNDRAVGFFAPSKILEKLNVRERKVSNKHDPMFDDPPEFPICIDDKTFYDVVKKINKLNVVENGNSDIPSTLKATVRLRDFNTGYYDPIIAKNPTYVEEEHIGARKEQNSAPALFRDVKESQSELINRIISSLIFK
jgi:hypothetical protein